MQQTVTLCMLGKTFPAVQAGTDKDAHLDILR